MTLGVPKEIHVGNHNRRPFHRRDVRGSCGVISDTAPEDAAYDIRASTPNQALKQSQAIHRSDYVTGCSTQRVFVCTDHCSDDPSNTTGSEKRSKHENISAFDIRNTMTFHQSEDVRKVKLFRVLWYARGVDILGAIVLTFPSF